MLDHTIGLTSRQYKTTEEFLNLFADVESALKLRLRRRVNDTTCIRTLIDIYVAKNPFWTDSANRLRNLADIRNLLAHQRGTAYGYPVAVAPTSLHAIREIKEHLLRPEPASMRYRKIVKTVFANDSLAGVLALAFENGFSQFPVVKDGRFGGLITENEIIRWLGRRVRGPLVKVDLAIISVRMVLKEKDPSLKGIPIFHFEKLDAPVNEVMGRFSAEPTLEAVLLTHSGGKDTPIEGIITQWDAARYPG